MCTLKTYLVLAFAVNVVKLEGSSDFWGSQIALKRYRHINCKLIHKIVVVYL